MTAGRITSINPDVRGDTLAEEVLAADEVLSVKDVVDFDENPDTERWLVIADSDPMQYVAVDDDANTITLAAPAGVDFEAGLPVVMWDPTVPGGGAKVVEYEADVQTDRGSVPAIIPHALIPASGVDNLIGAWVPIEEDDDGRDVIGQPTGRDARLDPSTFATPYVEGSLAADLPIPDSTWVTIDSWVHFSADFETRVGYPGKFFALKSGRYDVTFSARWQVNGSNRRKSRIMKHGYTGDTDYDEDLRSADASDPVTNKSSFTFNLAEGEAISLQVRQTSGADLDLIGTKTSFSATHVGRA